MKMPKKLSSKKAAKATANKWFSRFIRLRDVDKSGVCRCITCGAPHHWKNIDCGHFQKSRFTNTRYDEENCHAQCRKCNSFEGGRDFEYGREIDRKLGEGTAERLFHKAHQRSAGMKKFDYEMKAEEYREKAKQIASEKGIEI